MNYENRQWIWIIILQNVFFLRYFFIFCCFTEISFQSLLWRHLDSRMLVAGITSWISEVIPAHQQSLKSCFSALFNHKLTIQDKANISDQNLHYHGFLLCNQLLSLIELELNRSNGKRQKLSRSTSHSHRENSKKKLAA